MVGAGVERFGGFAITFASKAWASAWRFSLTRFITSSIG